MAESITRFEDDSTRYIVEAGRLGTSASIITSLDALHGMMPNDNIKINSLPEKQHALVM